MIIERIQPISEINNLPNKELENLIKVLNKGDCNNYDSSCCNDAFIRELEIALENSSQQQK